MLCGMILAFESFHLQETSLGVGVIVISVDSMFERMFVRLVCF